MLFTGSGIFFDFYDANLLFNVKSFSYEHTGKRS